MVIYALVDPRDSRWRYIGKTEKPLAARVAEHVKVARRGASRHVSNWLRALAQLGLEPRALALEVCASPAALSAAEVEWIAEARRVGISLTNLTDGGDGTHGRQASPETRAKMSRAKKGRPSPAQSPESREKTAAFHRGRKRSPETCVRIGDSRRGRPGKKLTVERRAALRAIVESPEVAARRLVALRAKLVGRRPSEATRAKMRKPHNVDHDAISRMRKAEWAARKAKATPGVTC